MPKKILIILIFLLVAMGVGYGIYYVFFRVSPGSLVAPVEKPQGTLPGVITGPGGQIVTSTSNLPNIITDETISAPLIINQKSIVPDVKIVKQNITNPEAVVPSADGGLKYFNRGQSGFYQIKADGEVAPLTDKKFTGVNKVIWSADTNKAILQYPDGYSVFYDFNTKQQATLPSNWSNFSFSPDGQKIAFVTDGILEDSRWLAMSRPDGTEIEKIEPVGVNGDKVIVNWSPNNQVVAFARTGEPQGGYLQEIYLIGMQGENFPSLIVNGQNFESKWSPNGQQLLYSVYTNEANYSPTLWITEAQGDNIGRNNHSLQLNTWADKCAFAPDGQSVYCGIPTSLRAGSGMWGGESWRTTDYLYKINLASGERSVLDYSGQYNISDLKISADGKKLYFTDHISDSLEEVQLP